ILVARRMEAGYRVVVNNRNWGMIYSNQIFTPVAVGDRLTAYVHRISEDGRIDLMLQQEGKDQTDNAATKLLELLRAHKGTLPIGDKSSPEEIASLTGLSKKNFKRAAGALYKQHLITIGDTTTTLNK
ncbi:MAG: hypothetical protein IKD05_06765, partial [Tidjanibacter sp.]|nr:hypothetical protein [Tidjanibacter sp.]